ncbi:NADH-quinone oxidoreductase subunit C [Sphingobacterium sp. DK4209]|uniref:NADH-quinone oxidoreductase subunit C n=1 Tax=Sphingobacterium zhuxiongii TaxID=2662364 RepID=A0A5Q0QIE8_9SPHI|nr:MULTISPECIES: NADH-quinone oxidoreductase subunit C [unclassified Sphingobacterium]MVZ66774.1 NADH-quinone oxidoreductase subunit C [Sphingobacterium sp. DK4209]QGA28008.1 NADH-quinone oxidoreductase subunit C [Sphingobacterium sp. dk4302]
MDKLNNQQVLDKLQSQFADRILHVAEPKGLLTIVTGKDSVIEILRLLKEDDTLQFIYLTDITAVHYPELENAFAVVYHVHSLVFNVRIRIKVFLNINDLNIPSATVLWNGANWMERETFDFFGINFEGHPDLRRILNMDDLGVFPMRKEYPLEDPNRVDKKDFYFGR